MRGGKVKDLHRLTSKAPLTFVWYVHSTVMLVEHISFLIAQKEKKERETPFIAVCADSNKAEAEK